jgi:hypothetical protein
MNSDPKNSSRISQQAGSLAASGISYIDSKPGLAMRLFVKALEYDPDFPKAWFGLGLLAARGRGVVVNGKHMTSKECFDKMPQEHLEEACEAAKAVMGPFAPPSRGK